MGEQTLDTFVCVHQRDVSYLLELVLRAYAVNFQPKGRLVLITNDPPYLQAFLERSGAAPGAVVTADGDWLSRKEMELPGWYRQQIIKLRAYEFCETENFCNLGADTVLLQPIRWEDMLDGTLPILYYTQHTFPNAHLRFERERLRHIGRILNVDPLNASHYLDFINDLFCFNRAALMGLNRYLKSRYGDEPYSNLLNGLDDADDNRNKFGEWTLYSVYLLDVLKQPVTLRNTRPAFLHQIHSQLSLRTYRFRTKVAHFVAKDFDVNYIKQQIAHHKLELRHHL